MASNKTKNKKAGKRQVRVRRPATAVYGGETRLTRHVRMLVDPCNAPLGPTAYRGADGIVSRFRTYDNYTFSTDSVLVSAYYPQYNSVWSATSTPTTAIQTNWNVPGPGQSFLLANADSQRPVGACIQLTYTGNELNRRGMIYAGLVPANVLSGTFTPNARLALLSHLTRVEDGTFELKWIPSEGSEEYWTTGSTAPTTLGGDYVMLIIVTGLDSTSSFNIGYTGIYEWRPKFNLGICEPTANTPDVPAGLEKVRSTVSRFGDWFVGFNSALKHLNRAVGPKMLEEATKMSTKVGQLLLEA